MKDQVNIGLCGLGTVGSGTAQLLQKNASVISKRTGVQIKVTRAATIDPYNHLDIDFSDIVVSDSVDDIIQDSEIDIVVELIGGDGLAKKIVLDAFDRGKSVVTANKALLAKHSEEIFSTAYRSSGFLGYEASVGGGIPIIRSVKEGFAGDEIESFSGIMNGTCNYILSAMTNEGTDFHKALKSAQEKGYAEADPTFDIEGIDTAHKVLILMELAFNALFDFEELYIEGITEIDPLDIRLADRMGYRIKLLGMARQTSKGFEGRIHPTLVSCSSLLGCVQEAFNAINVKGNFVGETMSYGAGAGSHPTASAVVADIIEISRHLTYSGGLQVPPLTVPFDSLKKQSILPIDEIQSSYFLRTVLDEQSDIDKVTAELKKNDIAVVSSTSFIDPSINKNAAAIITNAIEEKHMQEILKRLSSLSFVDDPIKLIRVES